MVVLNVLQIMRARQFLFFYAFMGFVFTNTAFAEKAITPPQKSVKESSKPQLNDHDLIPHRAEYKVMLHKSDNPDIADVSGVLKTSLKNTGNGWAFEQHSSVAVLYKDMSVDVYKTSVVSWESFNEDRYRFDVTNHKNGIEEVAIRGYARLNPNKSGIVDYELPRKQKKYLPPHTLFPLAHFKRILSAAISSEKKPLRHTVFDGASESFESIDVHTVIGMPFSPKIKPHGSNIVDFGKAWPIESSVYDFGSKDMDPNYETQQTIIKHGIATALNMNFYENGFTAKLLLHKLEMFL